MRGHQVNDARALRVAEIMSDFRTLQYYIAQYKANPSAEDYHEEGYAILRQCEAEAQSVLSADFNAGTSQSAPSNGEQEKTQLRRVLLDASARRFQAQKIYLRAAAAVRWANSRNAILQGLKPHVGHVPALQATDNSLRMDLTMITDERVLTDLRGGDYQAGRWIQEDPSLASIQSWIRAQR
ncbi:MAG: hypothetical protein M1827_004170 [Pycnora praestabilis]|nr:MAG: hypothetical protein M1827_004170 [Pycnora praestabilis]